MPGLSLRRIWLSGEECDESRWVAMWWWEKEDEVVTRVIEIIPAELGTYSSCMTLRKLK